MLTSDIGGVKRVCPCGWGRVSPDVTDEAQVNVLLCSPLVRVERYV